MHSRGVGHSNDSGNLYDTENPPIYLWNPSRSMPGLARSPGTSLRRAGDAGSWPSVGTTSWSRDSTNLRALDAGPILRLVFCRIGEATVNSKDEEKLWGQVDL